MDPLMGSSQSKIRNTLFPLSEFGPFHFVAVVKVFPASCDMNVGWHLADVCCGGSPVKRSMKRCAPQDIRGMGRAR